MFAKKINIFIGTVSPLLSSNLEVGSRGSGIQHSVKVYLTN
jgi:hypothetical protein